MSSLEIRSRHLLVSKSLTFSAHNHNVRLSFFSFLNSQMFIWEDCLKVV